MTDETHVDGSPERSSIPTELTWDLTTIYKTDADWEADFARVAASLKDIAAFKGRLKRSGKTLLKCYQLTDEISMIVGKLFVYAKMRADEDANNSVYKALAERIETLNQDVSAACAFIAPELLAVKPERIAQWLAKVPGLDLYRRRLVELDRQRPHTRSHEIEEILANCGEMAGAPDAVRKQFAEADLQFPKVLDAQGRLVSLTDENFGDEFMQNPDREVRKRAFETLMGTFGTYRNTFAAMYSAQVKADRFFAKVRGYRSCLESALQPLELPVSMYRTLIDTVDANLPKMARYLEVKRRALGVEKMHLYDLYAPMVHGVETAYTWEQGQELVYNALAVLGEEYVSALRAGVKARWVDLLPNKGKNTGAYSWGSYATAPFMLLNWHDNLDNVFTFAHEAGHSMHSYLSRRQQPFAYGDYTLFLAEVASTCNEALLRHHLLRTVPNGPVRQAVLNNALEDFRTTLFRQVLFAEFELQAHELAESGEALTPDALCAMYRKLNEKYYGSVCHIDDGIENEWMRIPHFWSPFYVYQYATGISSATALAKMITEGGDAERQRYLKFLSAGSSDSSINLLKAAGVDLTSPAPIQAALDTFASYLDEFEKNLG